MAPQFVLSMTREEFIVLLAVSGSILGDSTHTPRSFFSSIWRRGADMGFQREAMEFPVKGTLSFPLWSECRISAKEEA
jgi:hypothetical protein